MSILIELIGYAAGILLVITMIPQVIKSYRLKMVEEVSLPMVLIFAMDAMLWTIYGYLINNTPVFLSNLIAFAITLLQIGLMFRYKSYKKR